MGREQVRGEETGDRGIMVAMSLPAEDFVGRKWSAGRRTSGDEGHWMARGGDTVDEGQKEGREG